MAKHAPKCLRNCLTTIGVISANHTTNVEAIRATEILAHHTSLVQISLSVVRKQAGRMKQHFAALTDYTPVFVLGRK